MKMTKELQELLVKHNKESACREIISLRNKHEREMAEANKELTELREKLNARAS